MSAFGLFGACMPGLLILSWLVEGRDTEYAFAFMDDVRSRLANRVQLTRDGHRAYLRAVEEAFGADVDYAQLVKIYGAAPDSFKGGYSPAECIGAEKHRIEGAPDPKHVSFLEEIGDHVHMVALSRVSYNFVKVHGKHRMSPARAAGVADKLWSVEDIANLVEASEPVVAKRGRISPVRAHFKLTHYRLSLLSPTASR